MSHTSLLSIYKNECDKITGHDGNYDSIIKGIKMCRQHQLNVCINITVTRSSISCLHDLKQFLMELDIQRISISSVVPPANDRNNKEYVLLPEDYRLIFDTLTEIQHDLGIEVASSKPLPLCLMGGNRDCSKIETSPCTVSTNRFAVDCCSGNVLLCSLYNQSDKSFGNIYVDDLKTIWDNIAGMNIDNINEKCTNCINLKKCGGMCKWFIFPGDNNHV